MDAFIIEVHEWKLVFVQLDIFEMCCCICCRVILCSSSVSSFLFVVFSVCCLWCLNCCLVSPSCLQSFLSVFFGFLLSRMFVVLVVCCFAADHGRSRPIPHAQTPWACRGHKIATAKKILPVAASYPYIYINLYTYMSYNPYIYIHKFIYIY